MNENENGWRFVKKRTAADDGAVYVPADQTRYRRTGGAELQAEAAFQRRIADLNYPVPHVLEEGFTDEGQHCVVEESLGDQTLHDQAVAALNGSRHLADDVVDAAAQVAAQLLR
ncbi:hypothetical protein [Streptomyces kaempferi]|uniref:Uncharacterized protein n=1 Tax=Streptomyces kaempferi TaxID=333725 RepID=A0ABW3XTA9_9ACTN